jgi:transcriptional regulator
VDRIGFGMVFLTTADGPRVAHVPLVWSDGDGLRFHVSRGNALTDHLEGARALIVVNGPHGYVSPRWYADRNTVPTWDYVAVELEGPVRRLDTAELDASLYDLVTEHEGRLAGIPWSADETDRTLWDRLLNGIVGFELAIEAWRPTLKLSQKKSAAERALIAAGQEAAGRNDLAAAMREFAG